MKTIIAVLMLLVVIIPGMAATNEEITAYVHGCLQDGGLINVDFRPLENYTRTNATEVHVIGTLKTNEDITARLTRVRDLAILLKNIGTMYPDVAQVQCEVFYPDHNYASCLFTTGTAEWKAS